MERFLCVEWHDFDGCHHQVGELADVIESQHELAKLRPCPKQCQFESYPDIVDLDLLLEMLHRLCNVGIQRFLDVGEDLVLLLHRLLHLVCIKMRQFDLSFVNEPRERNDFHFLSGAEQIIDFASILWVLRFSRPCGQLHIEVELTVYACNGLKVDLSNRVDSRTVQQEVLRLHRIILPSISFEFEGRHASLVNLNVPDAAERAIALDVHVELRFGDLLRGVRCEQVCDHPCMLFVFHEVQFDSWLELDHIRIIKVGLVLLLRIVDLLIRQPNREL